MMKFINAITGSEMWVAENRAGEYRAAGHRPAAFPDTKKPALAEKMEELTESLKKDEIDKPAAKKTTRKTKK